METHPPLELGYWAIRGLAQPIRLILEHTGTSYKDTRYTVGEAPDYSRESWNSVKHSLGLDFPNLPYLIDETEDVRITQSNAIISYIGRKTEMMGTSVKSSAHVEMMLEEAMDFRNTIVRLAYHNYEQGYANFASKYVPRRLETLSTYLGDKLWFCEELTVVDFVLYELMDQTRLMVPGAVKGNLLDFLTRVEELPRIKKYLASDRCITRPINNPTAGFK